jgi:aryl-alcohol dehydrogenase-like predicted oxidoreductase
VLEALAAAGESGKVRVAAYSGENPALEWALTQPAIRSVQVSVNVCDQAVLRGQLAMAAARGIGVLAKRPLATAPWRGNGAEPVYAKRFEALARVLGPVDDWRPRRFASPRLRRACTAASWARAVWRTWRRRWPPWNTGRWIRR